MEKNTVRRRIFISNTLMILVTLVLFLLINMVIIKVYAESVEEEFRVSADQSLDDDDLEDMVKNWTIKKRPFHPAVSGGWSVLYHSTDGSQPDIHAKPDEAYHGTVGCSG